MSKLVICKKYKAAEYCPYYKDFPWFTCAECYHGGPHVELKDWCGKNIFSTKHKCRTATKEEIIDAKIRECL